MPERSKWCCRSRTCAISAIKPPNLIRLCDISVPLKLKSLLRQTWVFGSNKTFGLDSWTVFTLSARIIKIHSLTVDTFQPNNIVAAHRKIKKSAWFCPHCCPRILQVIIIVIITQHFFYGFIYLPSTKQSRCIYFSLRCFKRFPFRFFFFSLFLSFKESGPCGFVTFNFKRPRTICHFLVLLKENYIDTKKK